MGQISERERERERAEIRGRIRILNICVYLGVEFYVDAVVYICELNASQTLLYIPVGRVLVGLWFCAGMMSKDTNWQPDLFSSQRLTSEVGTSFRLKLSKKALQANLFSNGKLKTSNTVSGAVQPPFGCIIFQKKTTVNHGDFTTTNLNTGELFRRISGCHQTFVRFGLLFFFFRFFPQVRNNQPTDAGSSYWVVEGEGAWAGWQLLLGG